MADASSFTGVEGYVVRMSRINGLTHRKVLNRPLRFPNGPLDSVRVASGYNHAEYETLRVGTFSRPSGEQLRTISFATLLTDWPLSVASFDLEDDDVLGFVWRLRRIQATGTPFQLEMGLPMYTEEWDIQMPATLRSVEVEERAGEPDTRYLDVSFVEFRDLEVKGRKRGKRAGRSSRVPAWVTIKEDGTGIVPNGRDIRPPTTLYKLSRYFYGTPGYWRSIRLASGIVSMHLGPSDDIAAHIKRINNGKFPAKQAKMYIPLIEKTAVPIPDDEGEDEFLVPAT